MTVDAADLVMLALGIALTLGSATLLLVAALAESGVTLG